MNGEPEKAIKLLTEPHRQNPADVEFQHVILDALYALGKNETDFDSVKQMPVFRLDDSSFFDRRHAYLKPKREPRDAGDLRWGPRFLAMAPSPTKSCSRRQDATTGSSSKRTSSGTRWVRARRKRDGNPSPRGNTRTADRRRSLGA